MPFFWGDMLVPWRVSHEVRPFGRGTTLRMGTKKITMVINHLGPSPGMILQVGGLRVLLDCRLDVELERRIWKTYMQHIIKHSLFGKWNELNKNKQRPHLWCLTVPCFYFVFPLSTCFPSFFSWHHHKFMHVMTYKHGTQQRKTPAARIPEETSRWRFLANLHEILFGAKIKTWIFTTKWSSPAIHHL